MIELAAGGELMLNSESEYACALRTAKAIRDAIDAAAYHPTAYRPVPPVARSSRRWRASRTGPPGRLLRERSCTMREDEAEVIRELTRGSCGESPRTRWSAISTRALCTSSSASSGHRSTCGRS